MASRETLRGKIGITCSDPDPGSFQDDATHGRLRVGTVLEPGDEDEGTGTIALVVEGEEAGSIHVPDVATIGKMRAAQVGRDQHASITDVYKAPFEFTGVTHSVDVHLDDK